ncbi:MULTISPECIES: GFA family protein [unclassified Sphingomonas]|uniref:GFA family protein n=1 Tax=unclassified Sphingomonas TaxID=196159 RepID=UPI0006F491A1|nr:MULTISPECIES: GFA family protein [unclassified Sphingomonas]KQX24854.1 aldehyde-activating protein [Sphingomonas sp. Root1294]KQY69842.1 aldehyde-activating protein [Sphingomonas sp. Root50]KRB93957.1 aldehyde-activating protein [Sphingomonas sp. Root720]
MAFEGSCHCGKVAYTVDADPPGQAMACNCSHCRRKGFLLAFFPAAQFRLERGEDELTSYFFHKHAIEHRFCSTCGTQPFAMGKMPDGSAMAAVNLRCVESIDPDALEIQKVDGASF